MCILGSIPTSFRNVNSVFKTKINLTLKNSINSNKRLHYTENSDTPQKSHCSKDKEIREAHRCSFEGTDKVM